MSAAELQQLTVPVAAIHPNPWNPNRMTERVKEAARESIRLYGFIDPLTVRPHPERDGEYQILDGEHRWLVAPEEGYEELPVIVLRDLSEAQAKKLTVILNETRGEADVALLGKLLADIRRDVDEDELRLGLPYSDAELKHLTEIGDVDWDQFERDLAGRQQPAPPLEAHTVALVFADRDSVERFHTLARIVQHERDLAGEPEATLDALADAVAAIQAGGGS